MLDNLIGNALKYVAPGTVPRVVIEAEATTDGMGVREGPGQRDRGPAAQRERIFESFQRASGEDYRGTGLGLAICRRIIQRHGGNIHVTDNPDGVGSSFEFTLPTTPDGVRPGHGAQPAPRRCGTTTLEGPQKRAGSRYSPHS